MNGWNASRWIACLCAISLATSLAAAEFRIGFAQADITPPAGWRRAGGFSEVISTGVNDPLMSKAMAVQDGATVFAFAGNDLCSVPRDLTDLACAKASQLTGLPVANLVITATHTHGGRSETSARTQAMKKSRSSGARLGEPQRMLLVPNRTMPKALYSLEPLRVTDPRSEPSTCGCTAATAKH